MPLKIDIVTRAYTEYIVTLDGSLDSNTYQQFEKAVEPMLGGGTKLIALDLAALTYISSAGLRVVFRIWKSSSTNNFKFGIVNMQPQIKAVFDIMQALPKEGVFTSLDDLDVYLALVQKKEVEKQK